MMTSGTRLVISPSDNQDVRQILYYTLITWGRPQRNAYFGELKRAAWLLQEFPEIGKAHDDGIREFALRHHVVLYRYEQDAVTILRVMHPRRLRDR